MSKKDGKTKDRVEVWRKNVKNLTDDMKKQMKLLGDLETGGSKNAEGGGELVQDYFDLLVTQVSKEIQDLMSVCK